MKRKSASFLAGVLVASMVATPLSYTNVYAEDQDVAEIVQQVEDTSGESENVQESAPAKEESKEEVKAECDTCTTGSFTGERKYWCPGRWDRWSAGSTERSDK